MKETLETLKKEVLGLKYEVKDGKLVINQSLHLENLSTVPEGFLAGAVVNGDIHFHNLGKVAKDFLSGAAIEGNLAMHKDWHISRIAAAEGFLKNAKVGGEVNLSCISSVHDDFMRGAKIGGTLSLDWITNAPEGFLNGVVVGGYLSLWRLVDAPKGLLDGAVIGGGLYLIQLQSAQDGFLQNTHVRWFIDLPNLTDAPEAFLSGIIIDGGLYLNRLRDKPNNFLNGAAIGGNLYLPSLTSDLEELTDNGLIVGWVNTRNGWRVAKPIPEGYDSGRGFCYFDGILSPVLKLSRKSEYTIYHTPFGYVVQKGEFTAHAKTVKQGIIDVEYKIRVRDLKHNKLSMDDEISSEMYRAITGACYEGMQMWMEENGIPYIAAGEVVRNRDPLKVKDVYEKLRKTNAYGFKMLQELIED